MKPRLEQSVSGGGAAASPWHAAVISTRNLRGQAVRGGAVTAAAQGIKFCLSIGSTVLLARMLTPSDYGLVAMVTGFTGVVEILKDGGLSLATVQRETISETQLSTLFWMNTALGAVLMLLTLGLTPVVSHFYHEPRLIAIMGALAMAFLVGSLGVQHQALLRRHLRFTAVAAIDIASLAFGIALALILALSGRGYWALVALTLGTAVANTAGVWIAVPWRPGRCAHFSEVKGMLGFGGNIVATRFAYQIVRGTPNILLGWWFGPAVVGLYQRAYALLMFAVDQIQSPIASVVLPPLARLQTEPARQKRVFLIGYRLIVSIIVPIVGTCAVYAEEIVALLLGPKWGETAAIFRWLALGGIMVALLNPQGLLLLSMGRGNTCVKIGLIDAAVVLLGYAFGLRFGALGVAIGFFAAKVLLCAPLTVLTFRGTSVTWREILAVIDAPLVAVASSLLFGGLVKFLAGPAFSRPALAVVGGGATLAFYALALLIGAKEWRFYRSLLSELRPPKAAAATA